MYKKALRKDACKIDKNYFKPLKFYDNLIIRLVSFYKEVYNEEF